MSSRCSWVPPPGGNPRLGSLHREESGVVRQRGKTKTDRGGGREKGRQEGAATLAVLICVVTYWRGSFITNWIRVLGVSRGGPPALPRTPRGGRTVRCRVVWVPALLSFASCEVTGVLLWIWQSVLAVVLDRIWT